MNYKYYKALLQQWLQQNDVLWCTIWEYLNIVL